MQRLVVTHPRSHRELEELIPFRLLLPLKAELVPAPSRDFSAGYCLILLTAL